MFRIWKAITVGTVTPIMLESGFGGLPLLYAKFEICKYGWMAFGRDYSCLDMGFILCLLGFPIL